MSSDENENGENTRGVSGVSTLSEAPSETLPGANGDSEAFPLAPSMPSGDRSPAGRDPVSGHFLPGNRLGRGSPLAGKAAKLRAALFKAVGTADMQAVIRTLVESAKAGDTAAAKVLLQYTLGDPVALDVIEKVEKLEAVYIKQKG